MTVYFLVLERISQVASTGGVKRGLITLDRFASVLRVHELCSRKPDNLTPDDYTAGEVPGAPRNVEILPACFQCPLLRISSSGSMSIGTMSRRFVNPDFKRPLFEKGFGRLHDLINQLMLPQSISKITRF